MYSPDIRAILIARGDQTFNIDLRHFLSWSSRFNEEWPLRVLLAARPDFAVNYAGDYREMRNPMKVSLLVEYGWVPSNIMCVDVIKALTQTGKSGLFKKLVKGKSYSNEFIQNDRFTLVATQFFCDELQVDAFIAATRIRAETGDLLKATIAGLDRRIRTRSTNCWKIRETKRFLRKLIDEGFDTTMTEKQVMEMVESLIPVENDHDT